MPHRFILVMYLRDFGVNLYWGRSWNDGYWMQDNKTGVISLNRAPIPENIATALHELGHGFGLGHHRRCVMTQGNNTSDENLPSTIKTRTSFCRSCVDQLASSK